MTRCSDSTVKLLFRQVTVTSKISRWTIPLRLLLLGLGGSIAVIFGIVLGLFFPQPSLNEPILSKILGVIQSLSQPEVQDPQILAKKQRQETLNQEIQQLQQELRNLSDRATQLEKELKIAPGEESLEKRIDNLQETANQPSETETNQTDTSVKITLPSNLIFTQDQTITLTKEGEKILNNIVEELQGSEGKTIRIAAHLDANEQIIHNRDLSYRQAKVIQLFLEPKLPESYRWIIMGYGQTRPLVKEDQQLNRRIEISVDN